MIIDLILDRQDGTPYKAKQFYNDCLGYGNIGHDITAAMDYGTEKEVKQELNNYIINNEYNPDICNYVNSVEWLT